MTSRLVLLIDRCRDKIGWAMACLGLYVATPGYRRTLRRLILVGMAHEGEAVQ